MEKISTIDNSIIDKAQLIKALFENGVGNTVENCRKDFSLAKPFQFPIPITYQGFADWRNERQRYMERVCEAQIILAHSLCQTIKSSIPFYDLLCCAYPTKDLKIEKYLYSEILKYTSDSNLFDCTVTELKLLNDKIELEKKYSISPDALPLINNSNLLPKDTNDTYDLYAVNITDLRFIDSDCILLTIRHDGWYSSNNKEITFKINNIFGKIELDNIFRETAFGLNITREFNSLQIQMNSLTKDYTILKMRAKSITVVNCECIEDNTIPFCE